MGRVLLNCSLHGRGEVRVDSRECCEGRGEGARGVRERSILQVFSLRFEQSLSYVADRLQHRRFPVQLLREPDLHLFSISCGLLQAH
jgi:hypothetical protein